MSNEPVAYINMERRSLEWAKPMRWETPTVANLEPVPLYAHPAPDVVAQLVKALDATKAWLDAEENHEFEPDFWKRANMARTAQNLVNAALAAAKEAGL